MNIIHFLVNLLCFPVGLILFIFLLFVVGGGLRKVQKPLKPELLDVDHVNAQKRSAPVVLDDDVNLVPEQKLKI